VKRKVLVAAIGAVTLFAIATASSIGKPTAASSPAATCTQQAAATVTKAKAHLPLVGPPSRVDMSGLKGKTLWIVSIDNTPWVQEGVSGFMAAAKAVGAKGKFFDSKGNITLANQGVATAVAQKAGGIAIWAIDPRNVAGELAKAKAAGIPVIDVNAVSVAPNKSTPNTPGIFGHVGTDWNKVGTWFADYMLAKTNCKLDAVVFSIKQIPIFVTAHKAVQREVSRLCPSCKVRVEYIDLATVATSLGRQAQTAVNRDPKVNYITPIADVFAQMIEPALLQAGKKIPMISHDGAGPTFKNIRAGGLSAATISTALPPYWGWAFVDQLGRASAGQRPVIWSLKNRIVDKSNIGKSDAQLFPAYSSKSLDEIFTSKWKGK
jgi:ABC-type sugar transport system substrate-binding protein